MSNVIEMPVESWNGLKRDIDAMEEHKNAYRSYWPSISARMATLRNEYPSDPKFGGALVEHDVELNSHDRSAFIEMGKWDSEYLADMMANIDRISVRLFVGEAKKFGEPKYAKSTMAGCHTENEKPKNVPQDTESKEKDEVPREQATNSGKNEKDSPEMMAITAYGKEQGLQGSMIANLRKASSIRPELHEAILKSSKYAGCNARGKTKILSPMAFFPGLPAAFAEKYLVNMGTARDRDLAKSLDKKIIANMDSFQRVQDALKETGVNLKSRSALIQADNVMKGLPAVVDVVATPTNGKRDILILGRTIWKEGGTEEDRKHSALGAMVARDIDEQMHNDSPATKGRFITNLSKWMKFEHPAFMKAVYAYGQALQASSDKCEGIPSTYPDTQMPGGMIVRNDYGV